MDTVLDQGVTNEGLFALAKAGCGAKLTSLRLEGECISSMLLDECLRYVIAY